MPDPGPSVSRPAGVSRDPVHWLAPELVAALVIQSCAESGVPVGVIDPEVIRTLVTLLGLSDVPVRRGRRRAA